MIKSCNFMKKFEKANELLLKKVKKLLIEGVSDKQTTLISQDPLFTSIYLFSEYTADHFELNWTLFLLIIFATLITHY